MFGLRNFRGSCWVNTCIQAVFRIPEVQQRYDSGTFEAGNVIDECLCKIWKTKGEDGLKPFFDAVRTSVMPAGNGIGDAHELWVFLCDRLPFLDELVRFKMGTSLECDYCKDKEMKTESVTEFTISTIEKDKQLIDCISESVKEITIPERTCEKCKNNGCTAQQLIGTFPKVMVFHMLPTNGSINYPSKLVLNKINYALISVSCYNGHWWGYGRDLPPGSWYTLDDTRVQSHGPDQFPLSDKMRLTIYYRLEN